MITKKRRKRRLTQAEAAFQEQLQALSKNVTIATHAYYALDSVLRRGDSINPKLKEASFFWVTTLHAWQLDYLMALARVIEPLSRKGQPRSRVNFLQLVDLLRKGASVFDKDSLRKRVRARFNGKAPLEKYLDGAWELTEVQIVRLEKAFTRHSKTCEKLTKLRDKVLAHGDLTSDKEVRKIFRAIPKRNVEALLAFLQQVHTALWSLYENGHRPSWTAKPLPEWRKSLADRVQEDVLPASDPPSLPYDGKPKKRGPDATAKILGFRVVDNGVGFDSKNYVSFETLDSEHKAAQGCRGVGRLLWLKAFDKVYVDSVYLDGESKKRRKKFSFDDQNAIFAHSDNPAGDADERKTAVHLHGFEKTYREASFKTIDTIARALFEHCLWYFVRPGGAPSIRIIDGDESIGLEEVYEAHMADSTKVEEIKIKGIDFELTHVKLHVSSAQTHKIAYCAANRLVKEESINGKINGLYGKINDENGTFIYACYVRSKFLDANVRADRTDLTIDEVRDGMFADVEISMGDIRKAILGAVESHLSPLLQENKRLVRERVDEFVNTSAPRYKSIIPRLSADKLNIDPEMPNKDLDVHLHKCLSEIENKMLADGHDIMIPKDIESRDDYQKRIDSYLRTIEDIRKSDLASYVSHRKVILDLLEHAIARKPDGSVAREDLIHKLIAPMGLDSTEMEQNQSNLWLIDERLTFHDYLASDKTIKSMPITGATDTKEPDLLALNVYNNPWLVAEGSGFPLASITVIELKRPFRNDAWEGEDKDPIEQAVGYLDRVRRGEVTTAKGMMIPNSENIPGFCYVIADLTPSLVYRCKMHGLKVTSDNMGWFGYKDNFHAYIEVISFNRLLKAAKERNRAFFDKLGLPTT